MIIVTHNSNLKTVYVYDRNLLDETFYEIEKPHVDYIQDRVRIYRETNKFEILADLPTRETVIIYK